MTLDDLYETYEAPLQRYANSLAHDADRADDLVQETFIRSLGHLPLLELLAAPQRRAWLKRTLKNLFIDEERARQRQERLLQELAVTETVSEQAVFAPVLAPNPLANVPDDVRELFETVAAKGTYKRADTIFDANPLHEYRFRITTCACDRVCTFCCHCFEMRYTLGMNSTEIGEALDIPPATVRSRLHFATQKLRMYRSNWE